MVVPAVSSLSPPRSPQEGSVLECWMVSQVVCSCYLATDEPLSPKYPANPLPNSQWGNRTARSLFSPYLKFLHCWFSSVPDLPLFLWFAENDSFSISLTLFFSWHSLTPLSLRTLQWPLCCELSYPQTVACKFPSLISGCSLSLEHFTVGLLSESVHPSKSGFGPSPWKAAMVLPVHKWVLVY